MSLIKRLFGGGGGDGGDPTQGAEPVDYEGFRIFPEPVQESGGHRIAARIEKEIGGELKTHHLIRADVCSSPDEAAALSLAKARQMIDQMGEALFS